MLSRLQTILALKNYVKGAVSKRRPQSGGLSSLVILRTRGLRSTMGISTYLNFSCKKILIYFEYYGGPDGQRGGAV